MKRIDGLRPSLPRWLKSPQRVAGAVLAFAVAGTLITAPLAAVATDGGTSSEPDVTATTAVTSAAPIQIAAETPGVEAAAEAAVADESAVQPQPATEGSAGNDAVPSPEPQKSDISAQTPPDELVGEGATDRAPPAAPAAVPSEEAGQPADTDAEVSVDAPTAVSPEEPTTSAVAPREDAGQPADPGTDAPGNAPAAASPETPVKKATEQKTPEQNNETVTPFAAAGGCSDATPNATVKGRILSNTGTPISGFNINTTCTKAVVTGADGSFSISAVSGDFIYLNATGNDALGYADIHLSADGLVFNTDVNGAEWRNITVDKDKTVDLGDLKLPKVVDGIFSGQIMAPAGMPASVYNTVTLINADETAYYYGGATVNPGSVATWSKAVPAGDYTIQLATGDPFVELWWKDAATKAAALKVHIDAGQKITGIDASPVLRPTISGMVTDVAGTPLSNVQVNAYPAGNLASWWVAYTYTDDAGNYVLTGLQRNVEYVVEFSPRSGLPQFYNNAAARADAQALTITGSGLTGINATIQQGASIAGKILEKNGAVTENDGEVALIDLEAPDDPVGWGTLTAGAYTINNVAPGKYTVRFISERGTTSYYGNTTQLAKATAIVVADGDTTPRTGIDITAEIGGTIAGTVTAPEGASSLGTLAKLYSADNLDSPVQTVEVEANGTFTFSALASNNYAVFIDSGTSLLVARWFGNDGSRDKATAISVADDTIFDAANISLHLGGRISGTVTRSDTTNEWDYIDIYDANGDNVYNAVNSHQWSEGELIRDWQSIVLEPGSYAVESPMNGGGIWWKDATDFTSATKVTVSAGETSSAIDIVKPATTSTVSGKITAPAGLTVSSAYASLTRSDETYDLDYSQVEEDRTFKITTDATGDFRVKVSGQLSNGLSFTSWYGDTSEFTKATVLSIPEHGTVIADLTIVIQPTYAYTFTVVNAVTGKPVPNSNVNTYTDTTASQYVYGDENGVVTGASGKTGLNSYTVTADGYLITTGTVDLTADGPNKFTIQLSPSVALSGTVTSANNDVPLSNVYVNISSLDGEWNSLASAYTYDGKYSFPNLAPGSYKLEFRNYSGLYIAEWYKDATSYETATVVTVGAEGAVVDAQLDLGGVVSGTIVDENGDPVAYAEVGLARKTGAGTFGLQRRMTAFVATPSPGELLGVVTQTDANGNYRLPPLPAGEYALYVYSSDNKTTWYNGKSTLAEADTFTVATGQTSTISTSVMPLAEGETALQPAETLSNDFLITRQPSSVEAVAGDGVSFTALASGDPRPTIQWECSEDGVSWAAIAGENSSTLQLYEISDASCKNYRAVFTQGTDTLTSEVATLTLVLPAAAPSQPDAATIRDVGRNQANITWTAPADNGAAISGYIVRLYAGGTDPVRTINAGNVTELLISGLSAGTDYQATVMAVNAEGESPASDGAKFTTSPVELPGVPENLVANVASTTSLSLTWSAPVDDGGAAVSDYEVTVLQDSTVVSGPTLTGGALALSVADLLPDTSYTVNVKAINSKGSSTTAAITTVTTPREAPVQTVPATPAKPAAVLDGVSGIDVSWAAPADGNAAIDGYTVILRDMSGTVVATEEMPASSRSYIFGGLVPGMSYTAVVTAHNSVGNSPESGASEAVLVPAQAPAVPGLPSLKQATASTLEVQWSKPESDGGSAVTGYTVSVVAAGAEEGTAPRTMVVSDPTQLSVLIDGLEAETFYRVSVQACNAIGCSASEPVTMTTLAVAVEPGTDPKPTPTPTPTTKPTPTESADPTTKPTPAPTTTPTEPADPTTPAPTESTDPTRPNLTPSPSAAPSPTSTVPGSAAAPKAAPSATSSVFPAASDDLVTTGSSMPGLLGGAAVLLLLAGGLLVVSRRKLGSHRK